ncbi:nuclear transport factor 2 family protein [Kitasatospora sp. NPDC036755]|uniref:YybH family protein n=1 Tax=Kitasatospora sp. NPDC036755 TaxID=3154600 RepID=UPI0033C99A80
MASESITKYLASDIEQHQELFGEAFNSGDADAVNSMYTEDAVGVWDPGVPLSGEARREYVRRFLSHGPTVDATVLQTLVSGDQAMLVVEWTIDTKDDDGNPERLQGVAIDVLKRGEDGNWRYVIDNPYGVSGPRTPQG